MAASHLIWAEISTDFRMVHVYNECTEQYLINLEIFIRYFCLALGNNV